METRSTLPTAPSGQVPDHARTTAALSRARLLVGGYVAVSVATFVAAVLLRDHPHVVTGAVWVRGVVVVISSLVMYANVVRAAGGSRSAYRRVRGLSSVMVAVIAAGIALPGTFPLWMKVDQGVCGLLLIGVAVVTNGRYLRSVFARDDRQETAGLPG